ncbi:hypothetical protein [Rhodanobacter sp. OR87]|uniref:hypothetical protein n=1 Tax=Rhodanobacter sp. OR87 TaxID=1076523 RepID=UPI0004078155|nr:hypothetical protein [Rhodanobacter sp. OR87]
MTGNITQIDAARERRADRPPPLSDAELIQLRRMLSEFSTIRVCCPIAKRAVEDTGHEHPANA